MDSINSPTILSIMRDAVSGGVHTAYAQKMVRLISRSNASPLACCVICASVMAGGDETTSTVETTKTGLHKN